VKARAGSDRRLAGSRAEDLALAQLTGHGLELLARNYRCRLGEIDLVMLDRGTLVLVEVRYRSRSSFGGALGSVGPRKQQRLIAAARHLLMQRPELARLPARFDVVAIGPAEGAMDWVRDAFHLAG
jgi:putative endonuclease